MPLLWPPKSAAPAAGIVEQGAGAALGQPALPPYRPLRPPAFMISAMTKATEGRARWAREKAASLWQQVDSLDWERGGDWQVRARRRRAADKLRNEAARFDTIARRSIRCQTTRPPETKRPRQGEVSIRNCGAHRFLRSGSDHPETPQTIGAEGGTRTHTLLRAADFESAASTDSATSAGWPRSVYKMSTFVQT